jgi:hypothetical protein
MAGWAIWTNHLSTYICYISCTFIYFLNTSISNDICLYLKEDSNIKRTFSWPAHLIILKASKGNNSAKFQAWVMVSEQGPASDIKLWIQRQTLSFKTILLKVSEIWSFMLELWVLDSDQQSLNISLINVLNFQVNTYKSNEESCIK